MLSRPKRLEKMSADTPILATWLISAGEVRLSGNSGNQNAETSFAAMLVESYWRTQTALSSAQSFNTATTARCTKTPFCSFMLEQKAAGSAVLRATYQHDQLSNSCSLSAGTLK